MKKKIALLLAAVAVSSVAYASPQTEFKEGQWELNAGLWNPNHKSRNFDSNRRWNFEGGVTYGINRRQAVEFQYHRLHTKYTGGHEWELNYLYSLHPQIAAYAGYHRIGFDGNTTLEGGGSTRTNHIAQIGVVAKQPLSEVLDLYAKGALGTRKTSMWEAGVNFHVDRDLDVNAGYRYENTRGDKKDNVTFAGFIAGLSYRFGGRDKTTVTDDYTYEEPVTTAYEPVEEVVEEPAIPENDYYFNTIHFDNDSDTIRADQKANIDAFIRQAKETGHTFKLVGRTDSNGSKDYNDDLAIRRVRAVAAYATEKGVDVNQLVGMYKGSDDPVDSNSTASGRANNRRVDIFEHK